MIIMFPAILLALSSWLALGACDNFTITSEVVFDLEVKNYNQQGDDISGQLVIGLFGEVVPVASLNFKTLCDGFKRPNQSPISYKKTSCHRAVRDMLIQCGDVFNLGGGGSTSIYGEHFNDENFSVSHRSGGITSMANRGKDTNGSQFFITLGPSRFFDKKHVAFGKVVKGYRYLIAINRMGTLENTQIPKRPVKFTDCNVKDVKKYVLSDKDMKTDDLEGVVSF